MKRELVTGDLVREWLSYDPECGVVRWKKKRNGVVVGQKAGRKNGHGYLRCIFFGEDWLVHRLIWLYVYDRPAPAEIDHINGVKDDNRQCNLREVSDGMNQRNTYKHRAGRLVGSYFIEGRNEWKAEHYWKGERVKLGYFKTAREAHAAWAEFRKAKLAELAASAGVKLEDAA